MPKIYARISTYESANTLGPSIRRTFAQTDCDIKVATGNDASTGNTERVVQDFDTPRVVYFLPATNIGFLLNVNSCLKRTSGDDIFIRRPEAVRSCILAARRTANAYCRPKRPVR